MLRPDQSNTADSVYWLDNYQGKMSILQSKNRLFIPDIGNITWFNSCRYSIYSRLRDSFINCVFHIGLCSDPCIYRYKGYDKSGFDCSGYIHYVFNNFGYNVPRSSIGLTSIGKEINLSEVKKGDLLFFKGRNINNKKIGHVSMVIEVDEKSLTMIHSTRRGIIIDRLSDVDYYKKRFITACHPIL